MTSLLLKPSGSKPRGFTLVELLLAVLILAIMMAGASPAFRNSFNRMTADDAAASFATALRYAQVRAVNYQQVVRVRIADDKSGFLVETTAENDRDLFVAVDDAAFRDLQLPEGTRLEPVEMIDATGARTQQITFEPNGSMTRAAIDVLTPGGKCRVTLGGSAGQVQWRRTE